MKIDLVVGGYIFHEEKVLLIHHRKLHLWLPVGGHIDPNETPDSAMIREAKEETNVDITLLQKTNMPMGGNAKEHLASPFYVNVHSVGDHDHCCFYYICKATNPEALQPNKELLGAEWFTLDEVLVCEAPVDVKNQVKVAFTLYHSINT